VRALLSLLIIGACAIENYYGKKLLTRGKKKQLNRCCLEVVLCVKEIEREFYPHGFSGDVIVVKGMHTSWGI
jgi:hypothetical protein